MAVIREVKEIDGFRLERFYAPPRVRIEELIEEQGGRPGSRGRFTLMRPTGIIAPPPSPWALPKSEIPTSVYEAAKAML